MAVVTVNNDLFPTHIQTVKELMERKECTSLVFERINLYYLLCTVHLSKIDQEETGANRF